MKSLLLSLFIVALITSAWAQGDDMAIRKPGKFGLSVKAGPAFPTGEFANEFKPGFAGFVDLPYNLSRDFQVYLGLGYASFAVDNDKMAEKLEELGKSGTTNIDAPYHALPLSLGINYCYRYKDFIAYLTMSLGMYFQTLETSGTVTINGVTTSLTPNKQSWSEAGFSVGAGALVPLGDEGWALDINAKFNSVVDYEKRVLVTTGGGDDISTRAIRYVSTLVGLSYTFQ